jgi:hypothetical protein
VVALISLASIEMHHMRHRRDVLRQMDRRVARLEVTRARNEAAGEDCCPAAISRIAATARTLGSMPRHATTGPMANRTNQFATRRTGAPPPPPPPRAADNATAKIQQLYGRTAWRTSADLLSLNRPFQVLVLGYHQSGTSILTRLLMMMGLWAGKPEAMWLCEPRRRPLAAHALLPFIACVQLASVLAASPLVGSRRQERDAACPWPLLLLLYI